MRLRDMVRVLGEVAVLLTAVVMVAWLMTTG